MSDQLRAALDALTPEQRAQWSKAMARAIVVAIEEVIAEKGGQPGEERSAGLIASPAPETAIYQGERDHEPEYQTA